MRQRLRNESPDYRLIRRDNLSPPHIHRTYLTAGLIASFEPKTLCDPACGDGSIVSAVYRMHPFQHAYISDISPHNMGSFASHYPCTRETIDIYDAIAKVNVDVMVLTEVLEHMDNPDEVLSIARKHADKLVVSSPLIRGDRVDNNTEHLWQWDDVGYREMLDRSGWEVTSFAFFGIIPTHYEFQLWSAR